MFIESRIAAEERAKAFKIRRRLELLNRIVAPFASAFSASLVSMVPLALATLAWRWWQGTVRTADFTISSAVLSFVGTLVFYFPPPGLAVRERVITRWLVRAAWAAVRGACGLAWEYVVLPIVESAYAVAMLTLLAGLTLFLVQVGGIGMDVAFGRTPRSLGPVTNQRDIALGIAFFFVCGVAIGIAGKVYRAIEGFVNRLVERDPVEFDPTRDGGRFLRRRGR